MSDAPVHERAREVQRLLVIAADSGQAAQESAMREELGLGHGELQEILSQLRDQGMASMVEPGGWAARDEVIAGADEQRVRVSSEMPGEDDLDTAMLAAVREDPMARLDARHRGGEDSHALPPALSPALLTDMRPVQRVSLSVAMIEALDDEALGALVRAGVSGSGEAAFELRVT